MNSLAQKAHYSLPEKENPRILNVVGKADQGCPFDELVPVPDFKSVLQSVFISRDKSNEVYIKVQ